MGRVRLTLDLEADEFSVLALRLALRSPRHALAIRHGIAGVLERGAAERTQGTPGVWRIVVRSGILETVAEFADEGEAGRGAERSDAPSERSDDETDTKGDRL